MTCMQPPEPDDADLLAFLDGEDRPDVEAHLRACPYCQERARELGALDGRLTRALFRASCPTSLQLGEVVLGTADSDVTRRIREHLDGCPHCRAEVAQLRAYLLDLEPEIAPMGGEGLVGRVRRLVAQWVSGPRDTRGQILPRLVPAMAGIRGQASDPLVFRAEEYQIALQVEGEADQPERASVLGLATGGDTEDMVAHLWQADREVSSSQVDDIGSFAFTNLTAGKYRLVLQGSCVEIAILDLVL